jgi:hypothetical protein
MNREEIKAELAALETKIATLNFDENGNAIDREYADKLFSRKDELCDMLFGLIVS